MDASHFPIVEYQTHPVCRYDVQTGAYSFSEWQERRSIDLRWVASARPWETDFTEISLCGSADSLPVRCAYRDFMRDWTRAKGLP